MVKPTIMNYTDKDFNWYRHLSDPQRSLVREELLNHKFFYDLKLAAFQKKSYLKIYTPTVDIQGYDVFLEDGMDYSRKFQLKSKMGEKTSKWLIHPNMILPPFSYMGDYGFNATFCPASATGFIVIKTTENKSEKGIDISYLYTDINIISLIFMGYIKKPKAVIKEAGKIYTTLHEPRKVKERIKITPSLMVKVKDATSLLHITGFLGEYEFVNAALKLNQARFSRLKHFGMSIGKDDPDYTTKLVSEVDNAVDRNSKIVTELLSKYSK